MKPRHGVTGPRIFTLATTVLLLAPGRPSSAQIEAPSEYQEAIEAPSGVSGAGIEGGVDAAAAQVEAGERSGLSSQSMRQVEEIVVQARKREEFLEETPLSVTALGEALLREANVTRVNQVQDLVPNTTCLLYTSDAADE